MEISENSRVWIYQSNRAFTNLEEQHILNTLTEFTSEWQAHGHQLAAKAELRYSRFIILMVDENIAGATGCSIDKSVNLMKQMEEKYHVNLFDRFHIAYKQGADIVSCNRSDFESLLSAGVITENTIVFNNLVQTVKDLRTRWEVSFKDSWHAQLFGGFIKA